MPLCATGSVRRIWQEERGDYLHWSSITIKIISHSIERFTIKLRIPSWSKITTLKVNNKIESVTPGTYKEIERQWSSGDKIELVLDMRCRIINAPHGSNRAGDNFQALIRGPIVLARDENFDKDYDQPVAITSKGGYVNVASEKPFVPGTSMQFRIPTNSGFIHMVDYASVNNWNGKHICTWLRKAN